MDSSISLKESQLIHQPPPPQQPQLPLSPQHQPQHLYNQTEPFQVLPIVQPTTTNLDINNQHNHHLEKDSNINNCTNNINNSNNHLVQSISKSLNREESISSFTPFSSSSSYSDFSNISSGTGNSEILSMGTIYTGDNGGVVVDFSGRDFTKIPNKLPCEKDKVESLVCSNNRILSIPDEFFQNFQLLTSLNLEKNKFKKLPKSFKKLQSLQILKLGRNKFKKFPKSILNISTIQSLDLSDNMITSIPKEINQMVQLKELYLSNNEIDIIPVQISELTLFILELYGNPVVLPPMEVVELGIEAIVDYLMDESNSRAIKSLVTFETQRQRHQSLPIGAGGGSLYQPISLKSISSEDLAGTANGSTNINNTNLMYTRKNTMYTTTISTNNNSNNNNSNSMSLNVPSLSTPKRSNSEFVPFKFPPKQHSNERLFNSNGNSVVIQASPTAITNTYYTPKRIKPKPKPHLKLSLRDSTKSMMEIQYDGKNKVISPTTLSPPLNSISIPALATPTPTTTTTTSPKSPLSDREKDPSPVISPRWSSMSSLVLGNSFIDQQKREEKQLAKKEKADLKKKKRDEEKREKKEKKAEKKLEKQLKKESAEFTNGSRRHTIATTTEIPIIIEQQQLNNEMIVTETISISESFNSHTAYDSGTMTSTSSSIINQQQLAEEQSQLSDISSHSNVSSPPLSPNLVASSSIAATTLTPTSLTLSKQHNHQQHDSNAVPTLTHQSSQMSLTSSVNKIKVPPQRPHVLQKMATVLNLTRPLVSKPVATPLQTINSKADNESTTTNGNDSLSPSQQISPQNTIKNDESVSDVFDQSSGRRERRGTIASEMDLKQYLKVLNNSKPLPPLAELLLDQDGKDCLRAFLTTEFSVENLDCWTRIENYKSLDSTSKNTECPKIFNQYITERSSNQVNLPRSCVKKIEESMINKDENGMIANLDTIFNDAQQHIFILMETDSYERFKKSNIQ
ncbi:hypothetical protein PPL_01261 [Heterostelium album PN500]|uniref:RGS domain-containing protein n=1 Tax=Heterostelium pallidum (strain ATCC 26659 / Pp 5 / PN500) TaxID=670386 RepID=D3AYK1_HETP5|nr:hypothetical protein PPL_01261 [Heterostelium album PN500]EFA86028.1 hypothetical protein PPL_01261 [Heterostelium album PN500]|eukprot:XP_020438134.1 hypothetical protein PPL_01261 [Heterostelium album PN500]